MENRELWSLCDRYDRMVGEINNALNTAELTLQCGAQKFDCRAAIINGVCNVSVRQDLPLLEFDITTLMFAIRYGGTLQARDAIDDGLKQSFIQSVRNSCDQGNRLAGSAKPEVASSE